MRSLVTGLLAVLGADRAPAEDLFFRPARYLISAVSRLKVDVLYGSFGTSLSAIEREQVADLCLVSPRGRIALDTAAWTVNERKARVAVSFPGTPGTYVLGAGMKPHLVSLSGKDFKSHLAEQGLDHVLAQRSAQGRLDEPSRERRLKFLKALLQAEAVPTVSHRVALGHGAEIVPEQNPYALRRGSTLTVRCLVDGKPWAGKVVFAGGRRSRDEYILQRQRLVTDADGRATVQLGDTAAWYVRFVAMSEVADGEADYESRWATLTFGVFETSLPDIEAFRVAQCRSPTPCPAGSEPAPNVSLSAVEQCLVEAHRNRCTAEDRCIVNCMLEGRGKNIGGGCYHLCTHPPRTAEGWPPDENRQLHPMCRGLLPPGGSLCMKPEE